MDHEGNLWEIRKNSKCPQKFFGKNHPSINIFIESSTNIRVHIKFLIQISTIVNIYTGVNFTGMEEFMVEPPSRPPPPLPPPRFSRSAVWHNLDDFQNWKCIFVYFIFLLRPTSAKLLQDNSSVYYVIFCFLIGNGEEISISNSFSYCYS